MPALPTEKPAEKSVPPVAKPVAPPAEKPVAPPAEKPAGAEDPTPAHHQRAPDTAVENTLNFVGDLIGLRLQLRNPAVQPLNGRGFSFDQVGYRRAQRGNLLAEAQQLAVAR